MRLGRDDPDEFINYVLLYQLNKMQREEEVSMTDKRYMYSRLTLILCIYIITIAIARFVDIKVAVIFPIIIVPAMILLWFRKEEKYPQ